MRPSDKDLLISIALLFLNIFIYTQIAHIRWGNVQFMYSAILTPMSANILFSILTVVLIIKSIAKGGRFRFSEWRVVAKSTVSTKEFKIVSIAMLIIMFLVFIAMPIMGFWISATVFILAVLLLYVKSFKPLFSIIFAIAIIGTLYGIFVIIFNVPIR